MIFGGVVMDWKREAIDKLKNYEAHKRALDSIPLELERLEAAYTGIRAAKVDGTPTAKGGGNRREDAMLSNIVHRDELKRRLKEARLWVEIVDGGLSILDDEQRLALDLCFIHKVKGSINELCYQLNVDKSAVYRRRDEALRRFTLALYGPLPGL